MIKCKSCDKPLSNIDVKECNDICIECDINYIISRMAHHMKEARITFEEMIRKLINEVDR